MTQPGEPKFGSTLSEGDLTEGRKITSNSGWNALTRTLAHTVPHELHKAKRARQGIHRLIRTGR